MNTFNEYDEMYFSRHA